MKRLLSTAVVALAVAGALVWGFVKGRGEFAREAETEQPVKAQQRVVTEDGERVVKLDEATQKQADIALATVRKVQVRGQLRAYGSVLDVQPLTELSRNYVNTKARLQAAQAKLQASKAAFERARTLHREEENVSTAQFQAAEATYRSDEAASSAADSEVRALAMAAQQAWGPVLGRALTDSAPLLAGLIERKLILVQITLPAGATMEPPETAFVEMNGRSPLKLHFVSRATRTDPSIQGVSFFYSAPAESGLLPGMNVLAYLPTGKTAQGTIVPTSAVVWWQGKAWLYLRKDAQAFVRREITADQPAPEGGYIVSGIPEQATMVVQGAQMLLSEELRAQAATGSGERQ